MNTAVSATASNPPSQVEESGSVDLDDPSLYIHRELSLLEFQRRVLALASDPNVPLLERLRFLTICSSNLDEFFEIRVGGMKEQKAFGAGPQGPDGLTPAQALQAIYEQTHGLVAEQYDILQRDIFPSLAMQGIKILKRSVWNDATRNWVREHFEREVLPVLTPMGLDPSHPFPRVRNKSLNFIVTVEGQDAFGRESNIAIVQVPRCLPRVIAVPPKTCGSEHSFVLLSAVVHANVDKLFRGMEVTGCYAFRVTRNSDLWIEEEEVDDLLHALKGELPTRNYGLAVRLEVANSCSEEVAQFLLDKFHLSKRNLFRVNGPVNLNRLGALYDLVDRADLKYKPFIPARAQLCARGESIFERMARSDIILHHPYEAFTPVMDLLKEAANDPKVLAIKQTLYRTGADSPLADSLVEAARNGKEVTAVVELRARFDEAANIGLATRLQEAGATVVYGIVGYKTHSKMLLIVRREADGVRRYVHIGTGNYHHKTARGYTDLGLFTVDPEIGEDIHKVFMQLTGLGEVLETRKVLQSPFTLRKTVLEHIAFETAEAKAGRPARIRARMNALTETSIMKALYKASQAGVQIDLVLRGICCLRPGIPGLSENIRVRSVIGRFLEHSRVWVFQNAGREKIYIASADWMARNLYRRAEIACPIEEPRLRERVVREALDYYFEDNSQAWLLQPDGSYQRCNPNEDEPMRSAQERLLKELVHQAAPPTPAVESRDD